MAKTLAVAVDEQGRTRAVIDGTARNKLLAAIQVCTQVKMAEVTAETAQAEAASIGITAMQTILRNAGAPDDQAEA